MRKIAITHKITILLFVLICTTTVLFCIGTLEKTRLLQTGYIFTTQQEKLPNILLLSLWRSGSTWVGELLQELPNHFYLYEPLYSLRDLKLKDEGYKIDSGQAVHLLKDLFQCGISKSLAELAGRWRAMYPKRKCSKNECHLLDPMLKDCQKSPQKIIKTVRLRLGSAEDLLVQSSIAPLKVIHLVRDPRGVLQSMAYMTENFNWPLNADHVCPRMVDDAINVQKLQILFPGQVLFLRYEDVALNREDVLNTLLNYTYPNQTTDTLEKWKSKVESTATGPSTNLFSTANKSATDWEKWRTSITKDLLFEVQAKCEEAMIIFGYKFFDSLNDVRDMAEPSISKEPCFFTPCVA